MSYTRYKVRLWNWDGESFSTEVEIFENYEEAERKFASTDVTTALPYIQLVKERIASGCVIEDTTIKEKNDPKPTNFEAITADAKELGRFLRSLPIIEAPWDTEFQKRYCSGCAAEKCNASECPTCGWEAAEAERRRAYLREHGLTLCADGLRRLIIPKNGGNEEMKYKVCDHCGAHLDNGETCDCRNTNNDGGEPKDKQKERKNDNDGN